MRPFEPLFRNPHLQTVASHYWPRDGGERRFPVETRQFQTEAEVAVVMKSQRPAGATRGEIVMVHGLESSAAAGYMRSLSGAALARGFAAHRFNLRSCGESAHLCRTLYHAGLTSDLRAVLRELEAGGRGPVVLVGFSLGGNVVLKLAGELGAEAPRWIRAVCGVSTPLDLGECARRINERDNRIYQRRFVRKMQERLRQSGRYERQQFEPLRSVIELDDRITAPSFGFGNAAHYYATQSCGQFVPAIRVPTLLVQARDDSFIPFRVYEDPAIRQNPWVRLVVTEHGGHLGFIAKRTPRFWVNEVVLDWVERLPLE